MIKTFTIYFLLGASCFSSALPTGGQIVPGQLMSMAASPNKNLNPSKISWLPTQTPSENHLGNGPLSRSQESENEINGGNNEEVTGDETPAVTEDKQLPPQPLQPQQHGPGQISPQISNKRPNQVPQHQPQPTAYFAPMGNHPPGMPVTQYSGIQMMGYQKELSGQQPVSHQQQMFYSGGSNSIPMVIYSDSERPPITLFLVGNNGDKQLQGSLKTGDFIPNMQPMNQMPIMYSQNIAPLSMPMPFVDTPSSPLNWDRQLSMFDTYSSPQYYPSSNILIKSKESQMGNRITLEKQMKPKFAENSGMGYENEFSDGRSAVYAPFMFDKTNMQPREIVPPWMIPKAQRLEKLSNMRSMMDWGLLEPKQAMAFEMNEPMERSSSNNWESPMVGSRYTSLPTSPYNSQQGHTGSQGTYNTGSTSYQPSASQYGSTGSSTYLKPGSATYGTSHGTSYPSSSSSTKYGNSYGSSNQNGHGSQGSSGQHGQGSSSYSTPGSSYSGSGSSYSGSGSTYSRPGQSYHSGSSYKNSGIVGSTQQQQMPINQHQQHIASPYNSGQESSSKYDKSTPVIAIVPVGVMFSGDHDQTGSSSHNGHIQHQQIPGRLQVSGGHQQFPGSSSGPIPASKPRSSDNSPIVGMPIGMAQYGLGVGGLGRTGIIGGGGYGGGYGNTGLNNQYSNLHNGQIGGQSSGASNNQQYGQENVNTGFVQPLPSGGVITTQVNSNKGFSGNNYGQGSQALGVNDQNYNAGGFNSNQGQGYNSGLGIGGIGGGILPGAGIGVGGLGGLNTGIGLGGGIYR